MKRFRRALPTALVVLALMAEPAFATVAPKLSGKHVKKGFRLKVLLEPVDNPPVDCVVDRRVVFEKNKSGEWTTIGKDRSNDSGVAKVKVPRKGHKGKYRAYVPKKVLSSEMVCPAEDSSVLKHLHK